MTTGLSSGLASLLCLISASLPTVLAADKLVDDAECDCYLTNGTNQAFYAQHRFYDFRALQEYSGVPDLLTSQTSTTYASNTSDFFESDDWNSAWNIQNWNNSDQLGATVPTLFINSPNNVYIESEAETGNETFLTMRTARLPNFQSGAEIHSIAYSYHYLSLRILARTTGNMGGVTAMFTYLAADDPANVQEADLEIRTVDPRTVIQYTNQPSVTDDGAVETQASVNATMPYGLSWTDWAVHRLDWTPTQSTWYVDGQPIATISYQVPRDPTSVLFNVWSDGGSWAGNMSVGGSAYMNIQWIEMVFNSTEDVSTWTDTPSQSPSRTKAKRDKGCKTVCSIDASTDVGVASELWSGTSKQYGLTGNLLPVVMPVLTSAVLMFKWRLP